MSPDSGPARKSVAAGALLFALTEPRRFSTVTEPRSTTTTPFGVAVRATAALIVVVVVLAVGNGGPAYFLQLGAKSPGLEKAKQVLGEDVPMPLTDGHDGDRFWQLARDPLLRDDDSLGTYLDRPVYRSQRIGYPLLAAPWGLLGEGALLWGLVLTNVGVAGAGTYVLARWGMRRGLSPLAGYLFLAHPLVWLSALFDLGDAVALGGLLVAVLTFTGGSTRLAVLAAVIGALAKESVVLGLGAAALVGRDVPVRRRAALVVPAVLAVGLWRLYLLNRPGLGSDPEVQEFTPVPFSGYWDSWHRGWLPEGMWLQAGLSILLLVAAMGCVVLWFQDRRSILLSAALPYALMAPFLSVQVVSLWHNIIRAVGPALLLAVVNRLDSRVAGRSPAGLQPAAR